ncbi:MAG: efflux RND transporter periplasmic adaptor subunit [Deferrisomatales bacterium]
MTARKALAVCTVLALVAVGVSLVGRKRAQVAAAPAPTARPTPVRVAEAERGSLWDARSYVARVEPWQAAEVSAQIVARVVRVEAREGDRVGRGALLALLDDAEIRSAVAEVEAQIAQARAQAAAQEATVASLERTVRYWERELQRDETLAREGAIAQSAADATADRCSEARGRLEAGRKSLEAARKQIDALTQRRAALDARRAYTRISSPFDGVVTRRLCDPGDLAAPGTPLLVVEDRSRAKLVFDVPQEDLGRVVPGTPVRVDGRPDLELAVSRLYPSLNPDRTLTVEAYAPGEAGLATGTYYPVEVVLDAVDHAVLVPEESLVESSPGQTAVFAVADGRTRAVPVQVLLIRDGLAAVEGIDPGVPVVRSTYLGWNRLASGEPVEVLR